MKINTYAVNCNDAWLNTQGDDISGSYVKYKDYQEVVAALEDKCEALAAEVQAVRWACGQVYMKGYNHGHLNTVDGIDYASDAELVERGGEALADFTDPDHCGVAADAILAEVLAYGVEMAACALDDVNQFNYAKMLDDLAQKIRQEAAQ